MTNDVKTNCHFTRTNTRFGWNLTLDTDVAIHLLRKIINACLELCNKNVVKDNNYCTCS
jgi:hypothetical protein